MSLNIGMPSAATHQMNVGTEKRPGWHIFIIDSHPIFRQGLRRILAEIADLHICGEADSVDRASATIDRFIPDMVIAEIDPSMGDPMAPIRELRRQHPLLPILVLSTHDEAIYAERMLSAGANGFIMKQADSAQLIVAIRWVLEGNIYVSKAVGNDMLKKIVTGRQGCGAEPVTLLSRRELQILQMIGEGLSTRESADALHISVKTIESHRQRIKSKLNLKTGVQLVQYAVSGRQA